MVVRAELSIVFEVAEREAIRLHVPVHASREMSNSARPRERGNDKRERCVGVLCLVVPTTVFGGLHVRVEGCARAVVHCTAAYRYGVELQFPTHSWR